MIDMTTIDLVIDISYYVLMNQYLLLGLLIVDWQNDESANIKKQNN